MDHRNIPFRLHYYSKLKLVPKHNIADYPAFTTKERMSKVIVTIIMLLYYRLNGQNVHAYNSIYIVLQYYTENILQSKKKLIIQ